MAKIEFENKQALNENANIPDINKVKDSDLNEIKNVVNQTILNSLFGVYFDSWSSSGTFNIGDIVIYDAILYENLTGTNTETTPDQDSTNWQVVNILLNTKINPKLIDKTDFIKNASNNSTTDTYSCDYINDKLYDSGWKNANLENGWTNISNRTMKYRKIGNVVYVQGTISGGTYAAGTTLFTLPEGFKNTMPYQKFVGEYYSSGAQVGFVYVYYGTVALDTALPGNSEFSISFSFLTN